MSMGEYMLSGTKNRILLVPVVARTLLSREILLELSTYGNQIFPLPFFPLQVSMDLAKHEGVQTHYLTAQAEL